MSFSKSIFSFFIIVILFLFFGISSVFAGNVGTTEACQIAKAEAIAEGRGDATTIETNGRFFCYDETNMNEFLQDGDAFVNDSENTSHLTIGSVHNLEPGPGIEPGARLELHVCRIDLLDTGKIRIPSPATSSHGGISKIIINTTDGTYLNGTPCLSEGNHFHMAGSLEAKGHNGWVEIETFDYSMNLGGYLEATGSIDVSGDPTLISGPPVNGVNGESEGYSYGGTGGGRGDNPSGTGGKGAYGGGGGNSRYVGGKGGFGGGSGSGSTHSTAGHGGGGGGTIKIQTDSSLTINGNLSANGGNGGTGILQYQYFWGGGGGGGGTIEIQATSSLTINGNLSANGGRGEKNPHHGLYVGGGGGGGTIKIQTDSSLTINGNLSANGGPGGPVHYNTAGGGGGGTIKITTKDETTISNSIDAKGGRGGGGGGHNGSIKISTLAGTSGFPLHLNGPLTATGNNTTGTIELKAFSVNVASPITGASEMVIESLATSTINNTLSNATEIKLNGFFFEINSPITTAPTASTSIEISSTSSLNILVNLTTHNTNAIATAGRIKLNSTSSSIYIGSPTIQPIISALYGKIELSNGTTTVEPDASIVIEKGTLTSGEIYLISAGNILLNSADAILSANSDSATVPAIGRIGIQNCGKLTIKGKILTYLNVNTGAISIYSNEIDAFNGSEIRAKNVSYIIFISTCEGLEEDTPGAKCPPLRATLNPLPAIIHDTGATCALGLPNIPPYKPEIVVPTLGSKGVPLCPYLKWKSGDAEGQNVTFQIYLSTNKIEVRNKVLNAKIVEFTTSTNSDGSKLYYEFSLSEGRWGLDPTKPVCNLEMNKRYYWKVIVTDIP